VLATMHGKQAAVAPALRAQLGLEVVVPQGVDTDALGTFTREVARRGTMEETAIAKARLGMALTGLPLGLASEGSYGPHPAFPLVPGGLELLVLVDRERDIVVAEHLLDDRPVFAHVELAPGDDVDGFLRRVAFPDHGLAVSAIGSKDEPVLKGLRSRECLEAAIERCAALSPEGRARVETDMRAHQNPTRMATIGRLAERLAARLQARCPECAAPGFGVSETISGLPCEECGMPSTMVDRELFRCPACPHEESRPRSDGLRRAPAFRCPRCNP